MEKKTYILIGLFFIFLQIVAISRNMFLDFVYFFWFCDFVPIILAVAFFLRNDQLIKGVVCIGLFPQILYIFSFIIRLFFGVSFLEGIDSLFGYNVFIIASSVVLHSATVIAFFFTYKIKPNKFSLAYSFGILVSIYLIMISFTVPSDSINYVFILSNYFGIDALSLLWAPLTFLGVVLPTYLFQYFAYEYFRRGEMKEIFKKMSFRNLFS